MTPIDEAIALIRACRAAGLTMTLTGDGGFVVGQPPAASRLSLDEQRAVAQDIERLQAEIFTVLSQEQRGHRCEFCWRPVAFTQPPAPGTRVSCTECAAGRLSFALLCAMTFKHLGMPLVAHQ
jgi:hypothetical protein